ncbi:hypothetical protein PIB30_045655 [Stylosanthes scabra]|uniref:3-hydroxyisobutyryl-CoA hydrolase n=1 Tax=Stylosanthes scabra TaxID=79078 RepID=A0ABU6YIM3_9FABA|nr:hypothetical protein [Stylosanthes scabra]
MVNTCWVELRGHWTYPLILYRNVLTLKHLVATYKKHLVCLIDGVVMGGGASLSMDATFRIVTENAIFAMPEVHIGYFLDIGTSYFLSKFPGYFGEYLGLTGTRLDGAEMVACGLATHFIPSMRLYSLENALQAVTSANVSTIAMIIGTFANKAHARKNSSFMRLETINKCFSKETVEDIIHALEKELLENGAEKWITDALKSMRSASPISLKVSLKLIRKGRMQNIEECLYRDYNIASHFIRGNVSNDFFEGTRAKLLDKDNKPKWEPSKLELVSEEMVDQCFKNVNHDEWERLQLPDRSNNSHPKLGCKL